MENKHKKKIALITIGIFVVFCVGMTVFMAFWKNDKKDLSAAEPGNIIDKLRILQVTGGKLEITEKELNGTLKTIFEKPVEKIGVVVKDLNVEINRGSMTLYAFVKYKNMNFMPNITGEIGYENDKLIFDISSVRVGKLALPKSLLIKQISNYANEDIRIVGDSIEISKYLLPFNAKNIYLDNDMLIAEVDRLNILKEIAEEKVQEKANESQSGISQQSSQNSQSTGKNNSTSKNSTSQNNNTIPKHNGSSNKGNRDTAVHASAKSEQANTLVKVSSQLNGVIADVSTAEEKRMMKKIQTVVSAVSKDPSYPYQGEANEVKAWYSTLQPEGKARVKSAILSNVNAMEILKLINIFGV